MAAPRRRPTVVRLTAYGVVLIASFGGGALVGAAVGPEPDRTIDPDGGHNGTHAVPSPTSHGG